MKKPSTCYICSSKSIKLSKLKTTQDNTGLGKFVCYQCFRCKNYFTYPRPKLDENLLTPDKPINQYAALERKLLQFFVGQRIKLIKQILKRKTLKKITLLDVGAGSCVFANTAATEGSRVIAIEPNNKNAQFASPKIQLIKGYFEEKLYKKIRSISGKDKIGIITLWHVLEHCSNLNQIFELCHRLLSEKGRVVVAVPNINSFQAKLGKNYWAYLDVPHHLYQFSEEGLDFISRKNGFIRKNTFSFSLEYEIFGWQQTLLNILTRSHNFFYNKSKKNRVIKLKFPLWTKMLTSLQIFLLPFSMLFSLLSWVFNKPACLIFAYAKE